MSACYSLPKSIDWNLIPQYYDLLALQFNQDLEFWSKLVSKYCPSKEDEVLEIMAGTGRVTLPLAKSGKKVVAVDYCDSLLKALKKKAEAEGVSKLIETITQVH